MKKNQNFSMMAGDFTQIELDVTDADGNFYPDLEDGLLLWGLYAPPNYDTPIIVKESGGKGITVPSPGVVLVTLEEDITTALPHGNYYHKLTFASEVNKTKTAATGILIIYTSGSEYLR
jgi:hypothetical protein